MTNPYQRLFIAINFTTETKGKLTALQEHLRVRSKGGNFTLPENLHLTLAFLGDCNPAQTAAIKSAMDSTNFDPFTIEIDRTGYFKGAGGDTWWAGLKENKPLQDLQRKLAHNVSNQGMEKRKFTPHITLGRRVITDASPQHITPFGETASKIHLMKSERIKGKLTYTSVYMRGKRISPI